MRAIKAFLAAAFCLGLAGPSSAASLDWTAMKRAWRQRIAAASAAGRLPIIDMGSAYSPTYMNPAGMLPILEDAGVVLSAWSVEDDPERIDARGYDWWRGRWPALLRGLAEAYPDNILPVPAVTGVISRPRLRAGWRRALDDILSEAEAGGYPVLGEFSFRRYPSEHELRLSLGGAAESDEPIDGPIGRRLFEFSQRTGVPFQIHYEPEDKLIPPLEKMLRRYPGARVIWRHAGRVRRPERAPRFTAQWTQTLRRLLEEHPNLYLSVASTDSNQKYPLGGPVVSLWWDIQTGRMKEAGVRLVCDHPWRILMALNIGPTHAFWAGHNAKEHASVFLASLPLETREIVAYKAAWKLLFNEELP